MEGSPVNYAPSQFIYDSLGNLIEVKDSLDQSTLFEVGGDGRVTAITDRRGQEFVFDYTTAGSGLNGGNLASVTAPAGPNSAPARSTSYTYDAYDRVTEVENQAGNSVQFQFDGNDRVTRQTDARNKYADFIFEDGLLDAIDLPTNQGSSSNRRGTSFTYDNPGRVLQVVAKTGISTTQMRVRHEYDGFSNLRKLARLKDSVEVLHQFNFDKLDRMLNALDPLLRETGVAHAPFCLSRTVTTPRGVAMTYRYDSLCQLIQVESSQELVVYSYDELGRLISISQGRQGRYGEASYGTGIYGTSSAERVTLLEYDQLDRVTKITFSGDETLEYEYDAEGAVTKMTDVHGKVTRYTYYNDGRLYQVIVERPSQSDRVFTYSYDAAGRISQIDYPASTNIVVKFSGPSNEDGWDAAGNLLHLRYLLSNSHLHRFAYTYDDSGNRVTMVDTPTNTANAVTWEYGYDWLNRLISVSRNSTPMAVYTYDQSDNRLSLEWPHLSETYNFTYDDANQLVNRKLGTTTVETFDHDDDGNMIARTAGAVTTEYIWSHKNELLERKVSSVSAGKMKYDAGGIRESKNDGTQYFSSGSVSVADMRPSNVPVSYFQGHQLLGMEVDGTFYYYLTDGLTNVRLVVNSSGTVVASSKYDEFGIPETDSEYTAGTADLRPHGYVGGLGVRNDWDSSGLHYMRQRYYDPGLARWLSQDPIGFAGGLNRYAGMANNPVNVVDPSGLQPRPGLFVDLSSSRGIGDIAADNPRMTSGFLAVSAIPLVSALGMTGYSWLLLNPEAVIILGPIGLEIVHPGAAPIGLGPMGRAESALFSEAEQVAARNGIDLSGAVLRFVDCPPARTTFGYIQRATSNSLVQEGGKVVINLTRNALKSPRNLVSTLKHELKHIEDFVRTGKMPEPSVFFDLYNWATAKP